MAKIFRFAGEIIFKNKLLFSLLVLQFVFSLFFALDCANRLYQIEYPRRVLEGLTAQNFAFFSPIQYDSYSVVYGTQMENDADPYADFNKLKGLAAVENVYTLESSETKTELRIYPEVLSDKLDIPMRRGVWLSGADNASLRAAPCVTSDPSRKLGEILSFRDSDGQVQAQFQVVGIASDPYFDFEQNVSGEQLGLSALVSLAQKPEVQFSGVEILWTDSETVLSVLRDKPVNTSSRLLFFDGVSQKQMEENLTLLRRSGSVLNADTSFDNQRLASLKEKELPQMLCVLGIAVAGFCCAAAIFVQNARFCLKVYFLCGATRRQNAAVCFTALLFAVLLAVLPYCILLPVAGTLNWFDWSYAFAKVGFLVVGGFAAVFLLLALITVACLFARRPQPSKRKRRKQYA